MFGLLLCPLSAEKLRSCGRVKRRGGAAAAAARGKTGLELVPGPLSMTSCVVSAAAARAVMTGRGLVHTNDEAGTGCSCK